jgi:hypothetical protein
MFDPAVSGLARGSGDVIKMFFSDKKDLLL